MNRTRSTLFSAARALPLYPRRPGAIAGGAFGLGTLLDVAGGGTVGEPLTLVAGCAVAGITGHWWLREVMRPQGTRGMVERRNDRDQRAGGVASWLDIQELASPASLRRRRAELRPSLAGVRRPDPRELGYLLATVGVPWLPGHQVWSSVEDVTLRVGAARSGKSLSLACHGLDAPGALLTTSTKHDLAENVHQARTHRPDGTERAVHVLNVTGYANVRSTVRWSILTGCQEYPTAARRAADLIPQDPNAKDQFWPTKAREVLSLYLHGAALRGARATQILRWASLPKDHPQLQDLAADIEAAGIGGGVRANQLRAHLQEADGTRKSVVATMAPALAWLGHDEARAVGDADVESLNLDVRWLITQGETLHVIAGDEAVPGVRNLIAAVVAEVIYQAKMIAGEMNGRLDPHLTVLLDEAALICPVALDDWVSHLGSRNITMHVAIQSLAQLVDTWGEMGARNIRANSTLLYFGGSQDPVELRELAGLTGETRSKVLNSDWRNEGDAESRWVPVLNEAQLSSLRPGEVVVRRKGLNTVIGWAPMVTDRKPWARGRLPRTTDQVAPRTPVPAPAPEPAEETL